VPSEVNLRAFDYKFRRTCMILCSSATIMVLFCLPSWSLKVAQRLIPLSSAYLR